VAILRVQAKPSKMATRHAKEYQRLLGANLPHVIETEEENEFEFQVSILEFRFSKTEVGMERVCFLLKVKSDRLEEYRRRHEAVWPDMLQALRETGWHNYSLFLRGDGLLVGYFETPDYAKALEGMAGRAVNERWQREMSGFFENLGDRRPDQGLLRLGEVFHLD
jgi:L-rhamnose mutarotase